MRRLRTYQHMANKEHWCDHCLNFIQPGEFYEGIVYANNGRIFVVKNHVDPRYPEPEDPHEEYEKSLDVRPPMKAAA